ncbi:MAG: hypothetical protein L6R42_010605 [Xanthoria sp. 1 TBL-2021]|nr:MAG: hypothetical protein L6R42_010605 [Xanthoria sp. 1 TBL-2021]
MYIAHKRLVIDEKPKLIDAVSQDIVIQLSECEGRWEKTIRAGFTAGISHRRTNVTVRPLQRITSQEGTKLGGRSHPDMRRSTGECAIAAMADREQPVTLRTRKFIRNPLLGRKQMVVDVLHPSRPNVSKDELRSKLSELYKASKDAVSVFGFKTQYGGGKSTGFALIYDSNEVMKKFEPRYRLVRYGQATKIEKASRQQRRFFLVLVMVVAGDFGTMEDEGGEEDVGDRR